MCVLKLTATLEITRERSGDKTRGRETQRERQRESGDVSRKCPKHAYIKHMVETGVA